MRINGQMNRLFSRAVTGPRDVPGQHTHLLALRVHFRDDVTYRTVNRGQM